MRNMNQTSEKPKGRFRVPESLRFWLAWALAMGLLTAVTVVTAGP